MRRLRSQDRYDTQDGDVLCEDAVNRRRSPDSEMKALQDQAARPWTGGRECLRLESLKEAMKLDCDAAGAKTRRKAGTLAPATCLPRGDFLEGREPFPSASLNHPKAFRGTYCIVIVTLKLEGRRCRVKHAFVVVAVRSVRALCICPLRHYINKFSEHLPVSAERGPSQTFPPVSPLHPAYRPSFFLRLDGKLIGRCTLALVIAIYTRPAECFSYRTECIYS
ncbi:hypothetical protein DFH11DRAFT_831251 [Phellopilus nigrolimitatus]|nr:hypothetical protein DFH11DRAFT_831251 [Phellopilus nigrolimitatus]